MQFNSWVFAAFLAIVLCLYYQLGHRKQNGLLLVASYFFYAWWDWRFLSLLLVSTLVDYHVGLALERARGRARPALLAVSLAVNLSILGFFKYFGFFAQSAAEAASRIGLTLDMPTLHIILPVGISFYTFQTMSYTIDVYRGHFRPVRDIVAFALFVAYFPQLVAGPIERAGRLLPQLQRPRSVSGEDIATGVGLALTGLAKKVAVAVFLAGHVDYAFAHCQALTSLELLLGVYCFALQIYCDFSGYSDIARGVSRLLGVDLMTNFRLPYLRRSLTAFWRSWHISLSAWLRDYVYIPLGGSRGRLGMTIRNLAITWAVCGLWHGARWTFVLWGCYHAALVSLEKAWDTLRPKSASVPAIARPVVALIAWALTFNAVALGWVLFRCSSLGHAGRYLARLVSLEPGVRLQHIHTFALALLVLCVIEAYAMACRQGRWGPVRLKPLVAGAATGMLLAILLIMGDQVNAPFIYFQF